MARIGIILGSIRKGRNGEAVARWTTEQAQGREHTYELVDLKDYPLPLMDAAVVPAQAGKKYDDDAVQKWSDKIDSFDGYVFVTAEYNQTIPGPFKNAFDTLGPEWMGKPITYVGYSFAGAQSAIENWRMTTRGKLAMKPTNKVVNINIAEDFNEEGFAPDARLERALDTALTELEANF